MNTPYEAPRLTPLGLAERLTAAVDRSSRTDFDENGDIVVAGLGSRDICDPRLPVAGVGACAI